jgi:hypothetical protein
VKKLRKRLPFYLGVSLLIPIVIAVTLLLTEGGFTSKDNEAGFVPGALWCWIGGMGEEKTLLWQMLGFYAFVAFAVLANVLVFGRIRASLMMDHYSEDVRPIIQRLSNFLCIFSFLWFWGLLNRLCVGLNYKPFWTAVLHVTFVPLQGFCNMFLFAGDDIESVLKGGWKGIKNLHHSPSMANRNEHDESRIVILESSLPPKWEDKKLFLCTFNMGEGEVPQDMSTLLPPHHDLYIIGLQECMFLDTMRNAMQTFLSLTEPYARYEAEIGSTNKQLGFHGYIAVTIFVKRRYVDEGVFVVDDRGASTAARGANLLVTRAANKGGVGLPCRFYDQRLAFATAHLASDSHGKTKLHKRLKDASEIIGAAQGLILAPDDSGFDFPDTNQHTFVLGDFNYRMSHLHASPDEILQLVAQCSKEHKDIVAAAATETNQNHNHTTTFSAVEKSPDVVVSADPWKAILDHDELHNSIRDGTSFSLFEEPRIRFAPSYQRRDGEEGKLTDDSDIVDLRKAFALKNKKDGKDRVPSYTDRILHKSFLSSRHRITCEGIVPLPVL